MTPEADKKPEKFLDRKNYGSIGHFPESRLGPGDRHIPDGQAFIASAQTRDNADLIIVQEKLDGANVGVYMDKWGSIHAVTRAGYLCSESKHSQHRWFASYVANRWKSFTYALNPGERLVGEWLLQAHGTRYDLSGRELFVAFDIMKEDERLCYYDFMERVNGRFATPPLLHLGEALPLSEALKRLGEHGRYGATDPAEGVIYRVERHTKKNKPKVDFLAKYVRPGKVDGLYLKDEVWNA